MTKVVYVLLSRDGKIVAIFDYEADARQALMDGLGNRIETHQVFAYGQTPRWVG